MRHCQVISLAVASVVLLSGGCRGTDSDDAQSPTGSEARCAEILDKLSECYPDLETEGKCTDSTVAAFDSKNVAALDCSAMDDLGKADGFAFDGCGAGEHVCGFIFCCADYTITRYPEATDWDFIALVEDFQGATPSTVENEQLLLSRKDLLAGVSWTWKAQLLSSKGAGKKEMAVELSQRLVEVPYDQFVARLPAQSWGTKLAYYIGGEVSVAEADSQGRAVRQVERMVLSPFPSGLDLRLGNNDMTKAEIIEYGSDRAKVFWRVYFSDNGSTEADVGSVEFAAFDSTSTLVTFHSAHRLRAPGGIHIPTLAVQATLETYFLDHIAHYAKVVK